MTRNPGYAKNGVDILNAWAETHTEWSGGTPHISAGEIGILMVMGAEILRHTSPAWTESTTRNVEGYFEKTVWSRLAVTVTVGYRMKTFQTPVRPRRGLFSLARNTESRGTSPHLLSGVLSASEF
jgi:hypothetical protein